MRISRFYRTPLWPLSQVAVRCVGLNPLFEGSSQAHMPALDARRIGSHKTQRHLILRNQATIRAMIHHLAGRSQL